MINPFDTFILLSPGNTNSWLLTDEDSSPNKQTQLTYSPSETDTSPEPIPENQAENRYYHSKIGRLYSIPILFDSPYPLWYYPRVLANIM